MAPRLLPLFPLPLVLFPGARVPLHVFEPRYRALLADRLADDRRFGIVATIPGVEEQDLPEGRAGCVALVEERELLPDGRSNIVVRGESRFVLRRFVEASVPWHVAEVEPLDDAPESAVAVDLEADELRAIAVRVLRAVSPAGDAANPALPEDPSMLAFHVAAMMMAPDVAARQRLLESRSVVDRARELRTFLARVLESIEVRAAVRRHVVGDGPELRA